MKICYKNSVGIRGRRTCLRFPPCGALLHAGRFPPCLALAGRARTARVLHALPLLLPRLALAGRARTARRFRSCCAKSTFQPGTDAVGGASAPREPPALYGSTGRLVPPLSGGLPNSRFVFPLDIKRYYRFVCVRILGAVLGRREGAPDLRPFVPRRGARGRSRRR